MRPTNYKLFIRPISSFQFFVLSFMANIILAYSSVPLIVKVFTFGFLVIVPFVIVVKKTPLPEITPPWKLEFFNPPSFLSFFFLFLLAFVARWFVANNLIIWPIYDNGFLDTFAWKISQHWNHQFFYGYADVPVGYLWIISSFYKIISPSLGAVWLYLCFFSFFCLLIGYGISRFFFNRSFSFLMFFFLAFSFWPLLIEAMCPNVSLALALECVIGGGLTAWHFSSVNHRIVWATIIGATIGIGYYFTNFLIAIPPFLGIWLLIQGRKNGYISFFAYLASFLVFMGPLLWQVYHSGIGHHMTQNWLFNSSTKPLFDRLRDSLSYITALFWGTWNGNFRFTAFWGGLWNPVISSAIFLGIAEAARFRKHAEAWGSLFAFIFLLLPGLLSGNQEMMRIAAVLPIGLGLACVGFQKLLADTQPDRRTLILVILLFLSFSLDTYQLIGPFRQWQLPGNHNREFKSAAKFQAYQILKKTADDLGPGRVFTEFAADFSGDVHLPDQTLRIACYPFNLVEKSQITSGRTPWVALLVNSFYRPFLQKRFPRGQWTLLPFDSTQPYGGLILGFLPWDSMLPEDQQRWNKIHLAFEEANALFLNRSTGGGYAPALEALARLQAQTLGDPLWQSCLMEKVLQCFLDQGNLPAVAQALRWARRNGYNCGLWDYYEGSLEQQKGAILAGQGRYAEALKLFQKAGLLNPRYRISPEILEQLTTLSRVETSQQK